MGRKNKRRQMNAFQSSVGTNEGASRPSIAQLLLQRMEHLHDHRTISILQPPDRLNVKVAEVPPAKPHVAQQQSEEAIPTAPVAPETPLQENELVCPDMYDKVEWQRALENKDYYELASATDPNGSKPWFQYPKHNFQYSELVYITPKMAQELVNHNPVNRPIHQSWVDGIKRDIENKRWLQTNESIAINKHGNMHDGQHRALGIMKAGRGWPIYVTWNVPPEAIYVTDSGEKRKINEKLGLLYPDERITHRTAALCRAMMAGLSSRGVRYTEFEIAEFAVKYHDVIVWVVNNLRGQRADLQAVIGKSLLWWGEAVVAPFVNRLKNVDFTGEGDPAKSLYLWLNRVKQEGRRSNYASPVIYYKKTLSAIHAAATGKDAQKLYQKQDDIFEWLPGWTVPTNAPCEGQVFLPKTESTNDWPGKEEDAGYYCEHGINIPEPCGKCFGGVATRLTREKTTQLQSKA